MLKGEGEPMSDPGKDVANVGCEGEDGLLTIHRADQTCPTCRPAGKDEAAEVSRRLNPCRCKKVDCETCEAFENVTQFLRKAREEGGAWERNYLISCPWCGEAMSGRAVSIQIQHLVRHGDKARRDALEPEGEAMSDPGKDQHIKIVVPSRGPIQIGGSGRFNRPTVRCSCGGSWPCSKGDPGKDEAAALEAQAWLIREGIPTAYGDLGRKASLTALLTTRKAEDERTIAELRAEVVHLELYRDELLERWKKAEAALAEAQKQVERLFDHFGQTVVELLPHQRTRSPSHE
jgi:hypothetical protein